MHAAVIGGVVGGAVGAAVTGAVAGALAESRAGSDPITDPRALVRSQSYDDPARTVRDEFMRTLKQRLELSKIFLAETTEDDRSPESIARKFGNELVLEFRTNTWTLEVKPYSTDFWFRYIGVGLLFNGKDERVLWTSRCGFLPGETSAPLNELAANGGQGLKGKLRDIGARCAKQLLIEFFGDDSAPSSRTDG